MNKNEEKKGPLRNFKFIESADQKLLSLKEETGRDMTLILEDFLLGRRQFRPEIERFIQEEMDRTSRPREEIIEAALIAAMKNPEAKAKSEWRLNENPVANRVAHKALKKSVKEVEEEG